MARSRSGYYNAIEYIGPRPQKPKKPNLFGGWVIVAIALGAAFWFGKPYVGDLMAAEKGGSEVEAERVITGLRSSGTSGGRLAAEALRYSSYPVTYDPAYYKIAFPNGDVPSRKGVAADLVIRCYRKIGVDLQEKLNEDMESSFREYPQLWSATGPDTNIDHRRVPNLLRFFEHKGESMGTGGEKNDYRPGDLVVWALGNGTLGNADVHIGIVVPGPGLSAEPWVVHHPPGGRVKWENALFDYQIIGHFRYPAE